MADEKPLSLIITQLRAMLAADPRTLAEIGQAMDPPMSQMQLSHFKNGLYRTPSLDTAERVAKALGWQIVLKQAPTKEPKP